MYDISALKQASESVRQNRDARVARNAQPLTLNDSYRALFARMATVSKAHAEGLGYCLDHREKEVLTTYLFSEANPNEKDILGTALLEDLEPARDGELAYRIFRNILIAYRDDDLRPFFAEAKTCTTLINCISERYKYNPIGLLDALSHGNALEYLVNTAGRLMNGADGTASSEVLNSGTNSDTNTDNNTNTNITQSNTSNITHTSNTSSTTGNTSSNTSTTGNTTNTNITTNHTNTADSNTGDFDSYSTILKSFGLEEGTDIYEACMELFVLICGAKEYRKLGVEKLIATAQKFSVEHRIRLLRNMLCVMDDFQLQDFVPMIDMFTQVTGLKGSETYEYALSGLDDSCIDKYELWICKYNIEKVLGHGPIANFWFDYATEVGITTTDMPEGSLLIDFKTFGIIEIRNNEAAYFYNSEYIKDTVSKGLEACATGEELEVWLHDKTEWSASKEHAAHWRKAHAGQWQLAFREYIAEFREHEVKVPITDKEEDNIEEGSTKEGDA